MYLPKSFRVDDPAILHGTMADIGAATIVAQGPDGLTASHVPIELQPEKGAHGTVFCHFAKPNPDARVIAAGGDVLLIFQGPQAYISPNWYPTKHQTGKAVPTWNYVTIHAHGRGEVYDDPARLQRHLAALSDHFEAEQALPWKLSDAPADYIDGMCRAIVGLEITLTRIEGKWKMSQNKPATDIDGTVNGLRARGQANDMAVAEIMAYAASPAD